MTEKKTTKTGLCGIVVTDAKGKCLTSLGIASDPRLRAVTTDKAWLEEGASKRLNSILLSDMRYLALVSRIGEGYLVLLSEPPTDTVLNFVMSVDFAYDIVNHVLSDPYDAMAIVDDKARVAFISPIHEKFFGLQSGEGMGRPVRDVIENTRLHHVVRTGIAEVGQVHRMRGSDRIVSRHPIRHDGKVVGAIGRIMFKGPQQVDALARRINLLEEEIASYKARSSAEEGGQSVLDAIIGQSYAIQAVRDQIRKIAPLDIPVLIQGESGTGKELVAQALHRLSARRNGRLVTVNAAALPETLVESELFGYEPGSFTGADRKGKAGKFEQADKGTIFLDEIGDMPLEVQSKLLRVLQDRMVERVGGDKPKRMDFRLCSATNRDLDAFVAQGKFRLDLFYRISPVVIELPSLNDRVEDIPLLLNHFVAELAAQYGRPLPEIDMNLASYLMERKWPGNIRQLRHTVERAFVFSEPGRFRIDDFHGHALAGPPVLPPSRTLPEFLPDLENLAAEGSSMLKRSLDELEAKLIHDAIIRFKGNKKKAAEHLGVSRSYLYKKLEGSP